MRKTLLFLFLLAVSISAAFAQTFRIAEGLQPPVGMQSPNAANLGAFGNVTVSQFTGAPNIEVPVYTVQEGSLSVPITLRYNASGFRPDEHPGWVGMGWSLHAGGVITRVVNRMPDEYADPVQPVRSLIPALGFYYTNEILNPTATTWDSRDNLNDIASRLPGSRFLGAYPYPNSNYTTVYPDSEPDEFSFVFPGVSGSFYKDSDGDGTLQGRGTWKVRCDQPVKVEVNSPADPLVTVPFRTGYGASVPNGSVWANYNGQYPKTFIGFTLTTADGTKYVFGHTQGASLPAERTAIEYSIDLFNQTNDYWTANAWYLTKIISLGGDEITFTYQRESGTNPGRFISQLYNYVNDEIQVEQGTSTYDPDWAVTIQQYLQIIDGYFSVVQSCISGQFTNEDDSVMGKLVAPVYLSSISCRLGEVQFNRSLSKELRYIPEIAYKKFYPYGDGGPIGQTKYPFIVAPKNPNSTSAASYTNSIARLQWQKLDDIVIKAQGQLLKTVHLTYSDNPALSNNDALAAKQRLTLLAVNEVGRDGTSKPAHRFSYYNEAQGGLQTVYGVSQGLPNYLMLASDHWGFYNNTAPQTSPTTLSATPNFPDYTNLSTYYPSRQPNENSTVFLRGMLTRVTYPTGGYTDFDYEQHRYGSRVDTMRTFMDPAQTSAQAAGGVRIKKITSATVANPGPGEQVITEYYYVNGYTPGANQLPSSGVLGSQIKYGYRKRAFPVRYDASARQQGYYRTSVFSSQSVLPACGNAQGSHVGYSQVVEKRSDGSYTKYYFTNFSANFDSDTNLNLDSSHFDEPPVASLERSIDGNRVVTYNQFSSRAHERGLLLQSASYSNAGACVQRRRIQYASYANGTSTDYARIIAGRQLNQCGVVYYALQGASYKLFTYAFLPSQETVTTFDAAGNNGVAVNQAYQYKSYLNRTVNVRAAETTTTSTGASQSVRYKYAFELASPPTGATDPVARALSAMTGLYLLNSPVETVTSRNGNITGATVQTYTFPGTSATMVKPYQTWQLEPTQPIADNQYVRAAFTGSGGTASFTLDPNLRLKRTCTGYDSRGNLLGLQSEGASSTAYLWDYAKSLPVAIAKNAAPNQVAYAGFEADVNRQFVGNSYQILDPNNWDYDPRSGQTTHLQGGRGFTGHGFYRLDGGWGLGRNNLPAGDYEVSFWAKGGLANIAVFADQELGRYEGPANTNDQNYRFVRFRVHVNQGNGVNIDAYGRQVDIDDVRLYPVAAQMMSYTHDPLVGTTSTSDAANRPTFFEYDGLQRLKMTRDAEGNIVKHLEYHYKQQ